MLKLSKPYRIIADCWLDITSKITTTRPGNGPARPGWPRPTGAVRVLPAQDLAPVDMSGGEAPPPTPENGTTSLWRFSLAGVWLRFSLLARGDRLVIPTVGGGVGALVYRQHDLESLREFTQRLTFNILIGNGDADLKNWSLIYRDRCNPTLAPAYDLVATFTYRPSIEGPETMALREGWSLPRSPNGRDTGARRVAARSGTPHGPARSVWEDRTLREGTRYPASSLSFITVRCNWRMPGGVEELEKKGILDQEGLS